jgi:hypothetical protein
MASTEEAPPRACTASYADDAVIVRKITLLVPYFAAAVSVALSLRLKYRGPAEFLGALEGNSFFVVKYF